MTDVLIAEDQGMLRSALASLLDVEDDMRVVAEVGDGTDIVPTAVTTQPDVAVLDIELPGQNGLDAIAPLRRAVPDCAVVIVTTFGRPGYVGRALENGARGFLVKDNPVDQLAGGIRRVLAGELVVDPDLATAALAAEPNPLTEREREVLAASAGGRTASDIAGALYLSHSTVRNYLSAAIGKTGARNRAEAESTARAKGWL